MTDDFYYTIWVILMREYGLLKCTIPLDEDGLPHFGFSYWRFNIDESSDYYNMIMSGLHNRRYIKDGAITFEGVMYLHEDEKMKELTDVFYFYEDTDNPAHKLARAVFED